MDPITQIKSDTSSAYRQAANKGGELGKDEFLRLLVTQLQNQDPVNPMDSSEFASQLAQFNSVEQLINVNDSLAAMQNSQELIGAGLNNTLASSLVGKSVSAASSEVKLGSDRKTDVLYDLGQAATKVTITIKDSSGNVVRTETIENQSSGGHSWEWNGKANNGNSVPEGDYTVSIEALNGENGVQATTYIKGIVEKVKYTPQGVYLLVNDKYIGLGDVEEIGV